MTLQQKLEEIKERSSRQWGLNDPEFQATKDISALILALAKCIEQRDELLDRHDYARKSWDRELKAIFEGDE
jgi:hypothetical protein